MSMFACLRALIKHVMSNYTLCSFEHSVYFIGNLWEML